MTVAKPAVLIVEDNHVVRLVTIQNIKRPVDVEIQTADNGRAAVQLVQQHAFALILMDIHMPEMDGSQATRLIRDAERTVGRRTPINRRYRKRY
jgi:two-component system sensor histidine kinase/response regulator